MKRAAVLLCFSILLALGLCRAARAADSRGFAADQPQWGEGWSRNMVSREQGLPAAFDPKTGRNIRWKAKLGSQTHSTPIVAAGRVFIGTNNDEPRDPKHRGDRGVLMCFEERTGKLLWQLVVPKRNEDAFMDWPRMGMSSTATVEGDRVYLVDNRGAVLCLDVRGLANGNDGPFRDEAAYMTPPTDTDSSRHEIGAEIRPEPLRPPADGRLLEPGPLDADILWRFDLIEGAGIWPHDAAHGSILIHGNQLYLNTGTGVDNTHKRVRAPGAPSLVVLDKHTGRLLARDHERIAPDIFHASWSSPSLGEVSGRPLIFFCGGNGVVYAFEPLSPSPAALGCNRSNTIKASEPVPDRPSGGSAPAENSRAPAAPDEVPGLKKVFQFDFDPTAPKTNVHRFNGNRREGPSIIYAMPVFHRDRLYVAGGGDIWWGKNEAWLKCIDVAALVRPDAALSSSNRVSGLLWSYPLRNHVASTPAVHDGMVFIADCGRVFHCVDGRTGSPLWTHDIRGEVWASPLVADGKIYFGTRSGHFYVLAAAQNKNVLAEIELRNPISATATAANRTLFVATMTDLYAIAADASGTPR